MGGGADSGKADGSMLLALISEASVMVSARLGITPAEARIRLLTYSNARGRGLLAIAAEVTSGTLRVDALDE